jgi:hypothetical protein
VFSFRGRVARQGDRGSHEYLLLHPELVTLFPTSEDEEKEAKGMPLNDCQNTGNLVNTSVGTSKPGFSSKNFKLDSCPSSAELNNKLITDKLVSFGELLFLSMN